MCRPHVCSETCCGRGVLHPNPTHERLLASPPVPSSSCLADGGLTFFVLSLRSQGFTALMYSSKLCISNLDLTRVLLNFGPSTGIEEKDVEEGNTPLHWAIVGGVMSPYTLSPLIKVIWADSAVGWFPSSSSKKMANVIIAPAVCCSIFAWRAALRALAKKMMDGEASSCRLSSPFSLLLYTWYFRGCVSRNNPRQSYRSSICGGMLTIRGVTSPVMADSCFFFGRLVRSLTRQTRRDLPRQSSPCRWETRDWLGTSTCAARYPSGRVMFLSNA